MSENSWVKDVRGHLNKSDGPALSSDAFNNREDIIEAEAKQQGVLHGDER